MSKERIGIGVAGGGRIGRHVTWQTETGPMGNNYIFWKPEGEKQLSDHTHVDINAVVSRGDAKQFAYLLRRDSKYAGVRLLNSAKYQEGSLFINGREATYEQYDFSSNQNQILKWDQKDAKIVVESTGAVKTSEDAQTHLDNGASLVILSCPSKDSTPMFVYGVNQHLFTGKEKVISNASCTTNCAAPVINLFRKELGLKSAKLRTIHTYTNSQRILDGSSRKGNTRGRSATEGGIISTTTGLSKALKLVVPGLENVPIESDAIRVNTNKSSMVEFTMELKSPVTEEKVVDMLSQWSQPGGPLFGVLALANDDEVGADFNGCWLTSVVPVKQIRVIDRKILCLDAFYDNEAGFSYNLLNMVNHIAKKMDL